MYLYNMYTINKFCVNMSDFILIWLYIYHKFTAHNRTFLLYSTYIWRKKISISPSKCIEFLNDNLTKKKYFQNKISDLSFLQKDEFGSESIK